MRTCKICGVQQEESAFYSKNKYTCRHCRSIRSKEAYHIKKEKILAGEIVPSPGKHPSKKICKICLIEHPIDAFYYTKVIDWYATVCKQCANKKARSNKPKSEKTILREQGLARCKVCGEIKPRDEFAPKRLICKTCFLVKRECPTCKKIFNPITGTQIYCSKACNPMYTVKVKICPICGKEHSNRGFCCSKVCTQRNKVRNAAIRVQNMSVEEKEAYLEKRRIAERKAYARKNETPEAKERRRAYQKKLKYWERTRAKRKLLQAKKKHEAKKLKRKTDPNYAFACKIRKNIHERLKGRRSGGYTFYLGCDVPFFRKWLESQWEEGMSWENYGIDG